MVFPESVLACIRALEAAGFAAYAVGGCVRDSLLGLTPQDYDLCTNAIPQETARVFGDFSLVRAGEKHGTIGVVMDGEVIEITTFRTEGDYGDSRHPNWVRFVPDIEDDLSRRDFTINAMACSPTRGFADPFGGREDLKQHILRAVGNPETRFREDALRILRGARFALRYHLAVEPETQAAMLALAGSLDRLARERVFEELCKLLPLVESAEDLLAFAPILASVIPELAPTLGFDQRNPHHAYDLFTHIAHVVAAVPRELPLRWAALLHDVGKVPAFTQDETGRGHFKGHGKIGAEMANTILRRLKAPNALRERVVTLIGWHMTSLEPEKKLLRRRLSQLGEETVWQLLALQAADFGSKGTGVTGEDPGFDRVSALLRELKEENACLKIQDLAVTGRDLMALGFAPGPKLGDCLEKLLELVQEERLPNEKEALLEAARSIIDN